MTFSPLGISEMLVLAEQSAWYYLFGRPEVVPVVCGCGVAAIALIAGAWRRIETHRADVELKRDMVARGMSVEEIERVLAAQSRDRQAK